MHSFEEMVIVMMERFSEESEENKKVFLKSSKEDLIAYHHTLGRSIRNEFKLWEREWKPDVRNGVDWSPDHPDALSMCVIEEVWNRLNNQVRV